MNVIKIKRTVDFIKENYICCIVGIIVFVICCWYSLYRTYFCDELSTFYLFIQEGPLYSATHYPYPNNHILYSVLSSIIYMVTDNPLIGLRGVAIFCSTINAMLIYKLLRRISGVYISLMGVFLYLSNQYINIQLAQGRGYTLTFTFLLLSLMALYGICIEQKGKSYYIFYAISLAGGLFAMPSYLYSIAALSVGGGGIFTDK